MEGLLCIYLDRPKVYSDSSALDSLQSQSTIVHACIIGSRPTVIVRAALVSLMEWALFPLAKHVPIYLSDSPAH